MPKNRIDVKSRVIKISGDGISKNEKEKIYIDSGNSLRVDVIRLWKC